MKLKVNSALIGLICLSSVAGIIRHDVSMEDYQNLANESQFDCVGFLDQEGRVGGSCVLISDMHLLTAGHNFIRPKFFRGDENEIDTIAVLTSAKKELNESAPFFAFNFKGKLYRGKRISIPSEYILSGDCDIALVELELAVDNVTPASIYKDSDELNAIGIGVGFGSFAIANELGSKPIDNSKLAGENRIDTVGGYLLKGQDTMLYTDFDHPNNPAVSRFGDSTPLSMEYASNGGDSGGGLFLNSNGKWFLIGITSQSLRDADDMAKWGHYGMVSGYTRVSAFADWVQTEINPVLD